MGAFSVDFAPAFDVDTAPAKVRPLGGPTWIAPWLTQVVTRVRAAVSVDRYNNDRLDWTDVTELDYLGLMQPRTAEEQTTDTERYTEHAVCFMAYDADVSPVDKLRVGGKTYEVEAIIPRDFAGRRHLEVHAKWELGIAP